MNNESGKEKGRNGGYGARREEEEEKKEGGDEEKAVKGEMA